MSEGDTVSVTIGADAAGVRSGTDAAKAAISGMSASGRADAAALNVEFQKLNATLAAMQVQLRQTSEAATGLKSYADWGAALSLIVLGYEGIAGAAALAAKSADFVKGAVVGAEQGAKSAGLQWIAYAESLAYVDQNHLHVRQSGEGMTAAYGRMSIAVKEWLQEFNLFGGATPCGGTCREFKGLSDGRRIETGNRSQPDRGSDRRRRHEDRGVLGCAAGRHILWRRHPPGG